MEIPIQVAVQICSNFPNDPSCVETIPNYIDGNVTNNNDNTAMGLVRISRLKSTANVIDGDTAAVSGDEDDDVNGNPSQNDTQQPTTFPIQYALPYGCSQDYLYQKCIQPMILNFLEGFDMSIVTYGQCGMGKTYTMYATRFDDEVYKDDFGGEPGIVVRAIDDIFMHLMKRPVGCRFGIKVGWLDLCGDEIDDLLDGVVQCYSIDDVFQCLRNGSVKIQHRRRNRSNNSMAAAAHNIFTIAIEQQYITADGFLQHRLSTASFCDLAGTQRQPVTTAPINEFEGNQQQQQQKHTGESVPTDISLQALERIVTTLCASSSSAPSRKIMDKEQTNLHNQYENTMLTKFLKDSFGGRAQTLMIFCVSPLACDALETIQNLQFAYRAQFVRNKVIMNTFSDNNKPIANFWDAYETPDINLLSKAIHFNGAPIYEKPSMNLCKINGGNGGGGGDNNNCGVDNGGQNAAATAATLAGLKFANSQWLKLVSDAEALFNKLLINNDKTLNEQDRQRIEDWMYLKRECDDCFGTMISNQATTPASIPHMLGPIQEKIEPGENGCIDGDGLDDDDEDGNGNGTDVIGDVAIAMQKVIDSDGQFTVLNETDFDNESDLDQFEFLPERITELMQNFSCKMNEIVDGNYENFVRNYPKGVMQSASDDDTTKAHHQQNQQRQQPIQPPSSPADDHIAVNLPYVKSKRSNSVVLQTEAIAFPTGRRRSIHAAAATVSADDDDCNSAAIPNTAELARLNRLADECIQNSQNSQTTTSSTNTVCREINEFLDNSDELHPLRMVNRNRATYETAICRLQNEIEAHEKQQHELLHMIKERTKERTQLMKQCQPGKQILKQKEEHLLQQKEKCEKTLAKKGEKKKFEKLQTDLMQIKKDLDEVSKIKQANRDTDTTIKECEHHIEKSKKQLTALKREIKNQKKTLEKLRVEFVKNERKSNAIHANNHHNIDTHITQLECVLKEKRMYLQQQTSGESQFVDSLRHEIRNLRSQRERLNEQQWACYQKLNGGNQLSDRQFLQYDVAKEVIDYAIEYKNQLISNKKTIFVESPDLMNQLKRLNEKEMRIVLYKCLQKIVDLRKSTGFVENELIRLEKELDKSVARERTASLRFQQFRLETNGYTRSLQNQYDKLLRVYLRGAAGMTMRNENAAPMLMSPSHILHSKHQQHYRHQQQRATINQIEYNLHENDEDDDIDDGANRHRNANQQQRHPYRLANPSSALVATPPSIAAATTTTTTTTANATATHNAFESFQKQKQPKFFMKFLKQNPLMLTNHSHSAANQSEGSGKVTVDKSNKKILIQQNKTH